MERLPWRAALRRPQLSLVNAPDMLRWPILAEFARLALPFAKPLSLYQFSLVPYRGPFPPLSDF